MHYTEDERYRLMAENFNLEDTQLRLREKNDEMDEKRSMIRKVLSAIGSSKGKNGSPEWALCVLIGCSILEVDSFATTLVWSDSIGGWVAETGVMDVHTEYAMTMLDRYDFDGELAIQQLIRLGWAEMSSVKNLNIFRGYSTEDSFLRIYLDVVESDLDARDLMRIDAGGVEH